jgi:pantothenate kinase
MPITVMIGYSLALERAQTLVAQAHDGSRVLIGVIGSPGVGKTVLAERLVADLNADMPGIAAQVPMDGYHLANATLRRLGRAERKGAIDTFDGWGYVALLRRLRAETGNPVYAPGFDRSLEEPVAASIEVGPEARIVVSEGNYLLAEAEPWSQIPALLDECWFCDAPEAVRLQRLVERHMRFGRNEADAREWAQRVDGANAVLIESTRERADIVVSTAD